MLICGLELDMSTLSFASTTQVKVTLPYELYFYVKSKADKFGLNLASYLKHLVVNDVKDIDIPIFKMSDMREEIALKAINDFKKGKTKKWDMK